MIARVLFHVATATALSVLFKSVAARTKKREKEADELSS
jgi:hypothetical protein